MYLVMLKISTTHDDKKDVWIWSCGYAVFVLLLLLFGVHNNNNNYINHHNKKHQQQKHQEHKEQKNNSLDIVADIHQTQWGAEYSAYLQTYTTRATADRPSIHLADSGSSDLS